MINIFKTNEQVIGIQAEIKSPVNAGTRYFSRDKNTGKIYVRLYKDGFRFFIDPTFNVFAHVEFVQNGDYKQHVYDLTVEDRNNGLVSFLIPDSMLGQDGRVNVQVYVDLSPEQTIDAGAFYFEMAVSTIDKSVQDIIDVYIPKYDDFQAEMRERMDTVEGGITTAEDRMSSLEERIEAGDFPSKAEFNDLATTVGEMDAGLSQAILEISGLKSGVLEISRDLESVTNRVNLLEPGTVVFTLAHETMSYPTVSKVMTWNYGLGLVPLGEEPAGLFGGDNVKTIPHAVEYQNMNQLSVSVPAGYFLADPSVTKRPDGYVLSSGTKSLYIVFDEPTSEFDDSKLQAANRELQRVVAYLLLEQAKDNVAEDSQQAVNAAMLLEIAKKGIEE